MHSTTVAQSPVRRIMSDFDLVLTAGASECIRYLSDHLFTLQQVLHDSWEFDVPTHTCFIDLRKAYDTVNRPVLWGVLQHIEISLKLQRLIRDLHTGIRSGVCAYRMTSDYFDVNITRCALL